MKYISYFLLLLLLISCNQHQKSKKPIPITTKNTTITTFKIAFGSCNNQAMNNPFWMQLTEQKPNVWIWGGDIIYSDTEDMQVLKSNYELQKSKSDYQKFVNSTHVIGTWDDHDFGMNDGGTEYKLKRESQQLFLDFMNVPKDNARRQREGVYHSEVIKYGANSVKVIVLDTRFFRTNLQKDPTGKKRYIPTNDQSATMLGDKQWQWIENELSTSTSDYNIIMSSVQFLSSKHGFECWGNMPFEQKKIEDLIVSSKAKGVIILSGDRHISEFSIKKIGKDSIPLMDFTSSGLTHSYDGFTGEENPYRVGEVVFQKSYGMMEFHFQEKMVELQMWGENKQILQTYQLKF